MALYFSINDIFDRLEKQDGNAAILVPLSGKMPFCDGFSEDVFIFSEKMRILDFDSPSASCDMKDLLEAAPLYRINMELTLDAALEERHRNGEIESALETAFAGTPLPAAMASEKAVSDDEAGTGSLRHPVLGYMETEALCQIYVRFLGGIDSGRTNYGFEKSIIGRHENIFLRSFDGFMHGGSGVIAIRRMVTDGRRTDHEKIPEAAPPEDFVRQGAKKALAANISDLREMLWAWLEADQYQMRRCRDILRAKKLGIAPRPRWARDDILLMLEKESQKQVFAEIFLQKELSSAMLREMPLVKKTIENAARGGSGVFLKQLLHEEHWHAYDEAALFVRRAKERIEEARAAGV